MATTYHVAMYQSMYWSEQEAVTRSLAIQQARKPDWQWHLHGTKATREFLVITLVGSR